jgi:ABC-2 type transport system permease protein
VKRYFDFYVTNMKMAVMQQFQYRAQNYFYLAARIIEPTIYLVVWSTIARQQGGSVGGYTAGGLAAYYIVWTLVRQMNIILTPYDWEDRIQHGRLSMELMRPIHPIHNDISYFAGWKFISILFWLPVAVLLALIFKPTLNPTWLQIGAFFIAIWGAYLVRTMIYTFLGLITFWTTRVSAIFELFFTLELVLSGRLVPMTFMPLWVQHLAFYLPFQWTFYFPINALVGQPTTAALLTGFGMQLLWILVGALVIKVFWHYSIRHFSSVGN